MCLIYKKILLLFVILFNSVYGNDVIADNEVAIEPIHGHYLKDISASIATKLRTVSNNELGVTVLQEIYDSLKFEPVPRDDVKRLSELVERLEKKIKKYTSLLIFNSRHAEEMYWRNSASPPSTGFPCCDTLHPNIIYNPQIPNKNTKSYTTCNLPYYNEQNDYKANLTEAFSTQAKTHPSVSWQYFLSAHDLYTKSNIFDPLCKQYDSLRHRNVYFSTVFPQAKKVLIIIDHGKSLSNNQLQLAKSLGVHIISTLSPQDNVNIFALSDNILYPNNISCLKSKFLPASQEIKFLYTRFIEGLNKSDAPANHSLGFKTAYEILEQEESHSETVFLIYISRGLLSSLAEGKLVLETIAEGNSKINDEVIINTCAVVDDGKPIMTEKQFLQDVAYENFQKYNISTQHGNQSGKLYVVNSTTNFNSIVTNIFTFSKLSHVAIFSDPAFDVFNKEIVVSMSRPCNHMGQFFGIVGVDVPLSDFVEDLTYFNTYGNTYGFILNLDGKVIMHPLYPRPSIAKEPPMLVDITYLEKYKDFIAIRGKILNENNGTYVINIKKKPGDLPEKHTRQYTWQRVQNSPFIVIIVSISNGRQINVLQKVNISAQSSKLVYHRLDLLTKINLCRHMRQLATLDTGVLFLSPSCFQNPYEHLMNQEISDLTIKSYMAYINDNTNLLANPGIKPSVRYDVAALSQVLPHWKQQYLSSPLSKYIVRSYAGTPSGVFHMYPGAVLNHKYDPTRRAWYTRAMEYPGRVVLTAPYLDVGGAGYIVTLSHTVFEGKSRELHSTSDTVMTVLGLDFTLGFFYKLLLDTMPFCEEENIKCFILDDKGYLIAHPSLIDPNGKGPAEQQHITHKEPLVANDVLNHIGFVNKRLCNSFSDRTLQRYYQFNISLNSVLTNLVHGEHCTKYQIVSVPGSNVFIGMVNSTCDVVTAFCPCSVIDRLCLNCNRMEQTECECPCECPLEVDVCDGNLVEKLSETSSCSVFPEASRPPVSQDSSILNLPSCFAHNCESYLTQNECFGILGCEWCQLDTDEDTRLETPFCTHHSKCFNGVLGSMTPYGDAMLETPASEVNGAYKTTTVGPVAGVMVGLILIIGAVVYCYRQIGHRHSYISSVPETAVRMSTLDNEIDEFEDLEDNNGPDKPESNNHNILLHEQELQSAISPYRVSTNYRRPPGCDSDHGYSTMTPHDDSEHLPCAEPLLLGNIINQTTIQPQQTEINQLLVPVTVHMVDTI